jgi:hypothetical protein
MRKPLGRHGGCSGDFLPGCEHRTVSRDGRIVCAKIARGSNTVWPSLCHSYPAQAVNCTHLRFSLSHSAHPPLVVRCSGQTQLWSDDTPDLLFRHAACAAHVAPIQRPESCATCSLHMAVQAAAETRLTALQPSPSEKVAPFPARERALAAS